MNNLKTVFKPIVIQETAPNISSDGGILLLKKLDERLGLTARMAACLRDPRKGDVDHTFQKMLAQRVYGIAMGWEDRNDSESLREDPLYVKTLGARLASQPTLSRFENAVDYKGLRRMSTELVDVFIDRHRDRPPKRIVIDIDATDDPTHGQQQFQIFSNFYDCHCYQPLLAFGSCDGAPMELLAAVLSQGPSGKRVGAILWRMGKRIKSAFPCAKILVRADAGFSSPEFYEVCDNLGLFYLVCLPTNEVLKRGGEALMAQARAKRDQSRQAERVYGEFAYSARSWKNTERRVIVKAEALPAQEKAKDPKVKDNARYVVTNIKRDPEGVYNLYCLRGDCENRIKELKLDLASGRTSCHRFSANAFRLMLAGLAYVLLSMVAVCLANTDLAKSAMGQIRLKFLKMAAIVEESTRRILIRLPRGHPHVSLLKKLIEA
jgi:hypothetical protein